MQHNLTLRGPVLSLEPRVEIGSTFYGRRFWGGDTNPNVKLLMLTHAFDTWACERVALRCDADNERSVGAIVREQWPGVRRSLLSRVEPGE